MIHLRFSQTCTLYCKLIIEYNCATTRTIQMGDVQLQSDGSHYDVLTLLVWICSDMYLLDGKNTDISF